MNIRRRLALPNSILFVTDEDTGEIPEPESLRGRLVVATRSCVVVGTYPEPDGPTSVLFTDAPVSRWRLLGMKQVFDGSIEAPAHRIQLCTAYWEAIATLRVTSSTARVRMWASDGWCPKRLVIVVTAEP